MTSLLRNILISALLNLMRVAVGFLSRLVPTSRSVVVSASPETEGNGIEVARALVRRYPGRVVWLRDSGAAPDDVRELADQGMLLTRKARFAGVWAYLRAEAVFFTHGLYGSPRPCARKPIVNLWHGDGPKDIRPGTGMGALISSTYLVGSTALFSGFQGTAFDVPADRVLITGNPRTDQFFHTLDRAQLAPLGISGEFVVWMPTFRRARAVGAVRVGPGQAGPALDDGHEELTDLLEGLRERDIQLVVKPHPMDADRRRLPGMVTLEEEDLVRCGVSLYGLLGASAGLVTDYSSVWVDYLLLDRPIAFLVPDRARYDRALFPTDVLGWVPGEVVDRSVKPFQSFLADLDAGGLLGSTMRRAAARRIGLNPTTTSADDLLDALAERGVVSSTQRAGARAGDPR